MGSKRTGSPQHLIIVTIMLGLVIGLVVTYFRPAPKNKVDVSPPMITIRTPQDRARTEVLGPYSVLVEECTRLYPDDEEEIAFDVLSVVDRLRESKIEVEPQAILGGAIYLMRNTTHPQQGFPGKEPFGSYTTRYVWWREKGLSHAETIKKVHDLKKF